MLQPKRSHALTEAGGTAHGFFTRHGGVSTGPFASLNCGLGSGDEPALVAENRALVAGALGVAPSHLLTPYQTHGAEVVAAERPWTREAMPKCDAIVTAEPGLAIGILTADCAPILFADAQARVIGAAHAGWRGAIDGITDTTVEAMIRLGARRERIVASIGPCIGVAAYEVGPEFEERFLAHHLGNSAFFERPKRDGVRAAKPHFDLSAYVVTRLRLLRLARVEPLEACTFTNSTEYFSFRRGQAQKAPDYGRQLSAIALA